MTSLKQQLGATGRTLYINDNVLKTASATLSGPVELFTVGKYVTDDKLEEEYSLRGLVPATLGDLISFDKDNRKILDEKRYVATHWKDADGRWCFATFNGWLGKREVDVDRSGGAWWGDWWFAGVRKSSDLTNPSPSDLAPLSSLTAGETIKKGATVEQRDGKLYAVKPPKLCKACKRPLP